MTVLYCLSLHPSISLEQAWETLELVDIEILYGLEEEGHSKIYALLPSLDILVAFKWINTCEPYTLPSIDWEAQWTAHGHHFQNGYVHIDFTSFGRSAPALRLQPGPGFGDLSHPTTRLMLKLLAHYLHQQTVIDIGCGCGVLALAAAAMGAPLAYGIDLDEEALKHSQQNALLNQLERRCTFCLSTDFQWQLCSEIPLILMNMIQSEQQVAWHSLSCLHRQPAQILTSGIRIEEKTSYIEKMTHQGWILQHESAEEEWLAFYFTTHDFKHSLSS